MHQIANPSTLASAPAPALDLAAIKARQQATWAAGDFGRIGVQLQIVGESLCEAVDLRAGERVLDVAAGNGNATLAAARRFADVTSTDYVPALLEQGRRRAEADRLPMAFRVADAERLPFEDASFDVALSTFGVMFFIAINSASVPKNLLESELFGYKRGAFTGAVKDKKGTIETANKGTLFLDEISELDLDLQAKLLRFLQEKEFSPLGSNETIKADVRIIGASNKDLAAAVQSGQFREDLYYRFNVVQIKLPPLRERKEDIPLLAKNFLRDATEKLETGEKELSRDAKAQLLKYDWPGNVRELENVIKRACVRSGGTIIENKDLLIEETASYSIKDFLEEKLKHYLKDMTSISNCNLYDTVLSEAEKALISIVFKETKGNQLKAAKVLGINRNTLRSKIKEYKIK